jgi:hypothetical protein
MFEWGERKRKIRHRKSITIGGREFHGVISAF